MRNDVAAQIGALSQDELTPIVRQILGDNAVAISDVHTAKIGRSMGTATAGIYRVTGRAQTNGGERSWSAVVKALGVPAAIPNEKWNQAYSGLALRQKLSEYVLFSQQFGHELGLATTVDMFLGFCDVKSTCPQPKFALKTANLPG